MKGKIKRALRLLFVLVVGYFCFRSYRLGVNTWKYSADASILGDIGKLDFKFVSMFNNNLYQNGRPVARLIDYQYRFVDDVIIIESIDRKHRGRYCSK